MERFLLEQRLVRESMNISIANLLAKAQKSVLFDKKDFEIASTYTYSFCASKSLKCEWHYTALAEHYQKKLPQEIATGLKDALSQSVDEARRSL